MRPGCWLLSSAARAVEAVEMGDDFIYMHDIAIFVRHVEEVDLVAHLRAVKCAFFDQ